MFCIVGCTKSDKICRFEDTHAQIYELVIFSLEYKIFEHDSLHAYAINTTSVP
jgi:hypothetical protein